MSSETLEYKRCATVPKDISCFVQPKGVWKFLMFYQKLTHSQLRFEKKLKQKDKGLLSFLKDRYILLKKKIVLKACPSIILEILNVSYSDFRFYITLRCRGHDVQVGLLCGLKLQICCIPAVWWEIIVISISILHILVTTICVALVVSLPCVGLTIMWRRIGK